MVLMESGMHPKPHTKSPTLAVNPFGGLPKSSQKAHDSHSDSQIAGSVVQSKAKDVVLLMPCPRALGITQAGGTGYLQDYTWQCFREPRGIKDRAQRGHMLGLN